MIVATVLFCPSIVIALTFPLDFRWVPRTHCCNRLRVSFTKSVPSGGRSSCVQKGRVASLFPGLALRNQECEGLTALSHLSSLSHLTNSRTQHLLNLTALWSVSATVETTTLSRTFWPGRWSFSRSIFIFCSSRSFHTTWLATCTILPQVPATLSSCFF